VKLFANCVYPGEEAEIMKKGAIAIAIVMAFVAAMLVGSAVAQTTKSGKVDDILVIKDPGFKKLKKAPVTFPHKMHSVELKLKCTDCHHVYKDGKNTWKEGDKVQKCSACHKKKKGPGKLHNLMNAYHKNCITCHKKMKKGPRKCNQCHPKKKKK